MSDLFNAAELMYFNLAQYNDSTNEFQLAETNLARNYALLENSENYFLTVQSFSVDSDSYYYLKVPQESDCFIELLLDTYDKTAINFLAALCLAALI